MDQYAKEAFRRMTEYMQQRKNRVARGSKHGKPPVQAKAPGAKSDTRKPPPPRPVTAVAGKPPPHPVAAMRKPTTPSPGKDRVMNGCYDINCVPVTVVPKARQNRALKAQTGICVVEVEGGGGVVWCYCSQCSYVTDKLNHAKMHWLRIHQNGGKPSVGKRKFDEDGKMSKGQGGCAKRWKCDEHGDTSRGKECKKGEGAKSRKTVAETNPGPQSGGGEGPQSDGEEGPRSDGEEGPPSSGGEEGPLSSGGEGVQSWKTNPAPESGGEEGVAVDVWNGCVFVFGETCVSPMFCGPFVVRSSFYEGLSRVPLDSLVGDTAGSESGEEEVVFDVDQFFA